MSGIPLPQEIPDIFIPPTQNGNAGVLRGRNENSGMTTGGGHCFTGTELGNDRVRRRLGRQGARRFRFDF